MKNTPDVTVWKSQRYKLSKISQPQDNQLNWNFEFVDLTEGAVIAYIKEIPLHGYAVHLTIPNTDPIEMGTISQICSELPKLMRSHMKSRSLG